VVPGSSATIPTVSRSVPSLITSLAVIAADWTQEWILRAQVFFAPSHTTPVRFAIMIWIASSIWDGVPPIRYTKAQQVPMAAVKAPQSAESRPLNWARWIATRLLNANALARVWGSFSR